MTEEETNATSILPELAQDSESSRFVEKLKSAKRDEVLERLASLLDTAFRKGLQANARSHTQQRWFTICGYLAQVAARVIRDLEYEKLWAEVEDLKKLVSKRNVNAPRGESPPSEPEQDKTRNSK